MNSKFEFVAKTYFLRTEFIVLNFKGLRHWVAKRKSEFVERTPFLSLNVEIYKLT